MKRSYRRQTRRSSLTEYPETIRYYVQRLNSTRTAWEYFDGTDWVSNLDAAYLWERALPADLVTLLHVGSILGIKNVEVR